MTVGNRTPQVTIEFPENGQIASFTDQIRYRINVTDPEDGTTGAGISCADVRVTISLGHDEHSHGLSQATGCEGTFNAGLTSGHGAEANTFTVLGVAYTDKGGPGGIAPLTGRAEAILQPKTKQAEFFASTGRVAGGSTEGTAGASTQNTTDAIGGGLNLTAIEDGDYVSYKPVSLKNISALRFRVASRPTRRRSRSAWTPPRARSWPRHRRSRRPEAPRPTRRSSCRSRPRPAPTSCSSCSATRARAAR